MTCWEHLVGAFCAHDSICMRISLSDFSVLISTQNKDRLCKCQAVCFGQQKPISLALTKFIMIMTVMMLVMMVIEVYVRIESLPCLSHSFVWSYNHYINDYTSPLYDISSWLLTSAENCTGLSRICIIDLRVEYC